MRPIVTIVLCLLMSVIFYSSKAQVLDKQRLLNQFDFWQNKDWDWYKTNIPFFESPDQELDVTYYYRWEMMTAHMVYGAPEVGYSFTEFIDRPWWSAKYGAISCAAGHHLYETRWLRDARYAKDYARYWFKTVPDKIRNYTTWMADAIFQSYKVHYDQPFTTALKSDLVRNFEGWEKERWVDSESLFAWDGMHDGMETNINSRQTPQWFEGAPGYRPTLNSYMWADANAIASIARMTGDETTARLYQTKAATIKKNLQEKCWDPKRQFFFHRFKKDEEGGIKANTLTYETGKFAGSPHGREEIGFIPWYFNLPDSGYEAAWKFLMDPEYFFAPFGPRTVEKNDPMFLIAKNCCAWSGNAWPFATAQTLKGMANLLKQYRQPYITKEDYFQQLKIFSLTHRKYQKPYIAEANHPETGSWDGHDVQGHSDHYFHSAYIDEIITGLMGITPKESDSLEVNPLLPDDWNYAALDNIRYHGRNLSVLWDKTGARYGKGKGLIIIADGKIIASSPELKKMKIAFAPGPTDTYTSDRVVNYAVNNERGQYYPRAIASFPGVGNNSCAKMNDGQYWYYNVTTNRWSNLHAKSTITWAGIDFGAERKIHTIKMYFTEDSAIQAPTSAVLQYWNGKEWKPVPGVAPAKNIRSRTATVFNFKTLSTSKIRALLTPADNKAVAISEIETWGPFEKGLSVPGGEHQTSPDAKIINSATVQASYTSQFDRLSTINDGLENPAERWTAFQSPNAQDTISFSFSKPTPLNTAYIFFYNDEGGVQPPKEYRAEYLENGTWKKLRNPIFSPEKQVEGMNILNFAPITTKKIRFIFVHQSKTTFTGIYELKLFYEK